MRKSFCIVISLLFLTIVGCGTADASPMQRLLYVLNEDDITIDIFDIEAGHKKIRSIPVITEEKPLYRGISAHAGTARVYISDSKRKFVAAIDLLTDKTVWKRTYGECTFPDRINVSIDGSVLYVPCKLDGRHVILDAKTGDVMDSLPMDGLPHNSFIGESGKYVYLSGYRNTTLFVLDATTHSKVKEIGGFSSPIRPFTVDKDEKFFFANLNALMGFGVGDIEEGKNIYEVSVVAPAERTQYPDAKARLTHADAPLSHGIAVRPGTRELWVLDDAWGYLYVFDTSPLYSKSKQQPIHIASVPAFRDITKVWTPFRWRWVAFSADGKYVYPSNGMVIDAETKQILDEGITPSEKLIEIDFQDGKPVRIGGQNGGVYE
jgi:DNA-binding beta-propeller fold protein YncE